MASKPIVPDAKEALNKFKMEAATELGVLSASKKYKIITNLYHQ